MANRIRKIIHIDSQDKIIAEAIKLLNTIEIKDRSVRLFSSDIAN